MAAIEVTQSELLEALTKAQTGAGPENAKTVTELAEVAGLSAGSVRKALRALNTQGRLVVHPAYRQSISGRMQQVPAYTITRPVETTRGGRAGRAQP